MLYRFMPLLLLFFLAYSCENNTSIDSETQKEELKSKWNEFIDYWEKEDVPGLVSMYTSEGINIPPDQKINSGRSEIGEFYKFLFSNNKASKYSHEIKSLQVGSKMAIEYGAFEVQWTRNDGSEWVYNGRSMTHWVIADDGDWEIAKFIFNNPPEE